MAPAVQTCVLRVGIKCCNGCQTNAKRKLLSVNGVSGVEYNAEQGLLTVTGDVNPTVLLSKLTKWGKSAELVSLLGDHTRVPTTPEHNQITSERKKPTKCCFLLRCFGSKAKVEPRGAWVENNGSATAPFVNPPMAYPPPQAIPGFPTPVPYPPPYFGATQSPPYTSTPGMYRSTPPQSPPYFPMVNSTMHYPHHH